MPAARELTRAEVARRRKVSVRTVDRWIASGVLPAYRVGPKFIRIRAEDLQALPVLARPGDRETIEDAIQRLHEQWVAAGGHIDTETARKIADALRTTSGAEVAS